MTRAAAVLVCLVIMAASVSTEIDRSRLALIDTLVEDAIRDGRLPGAVVVVGHAGRSSTRGHSVLARLMVRKRR